MLEQHGGIVIAALAQAVAPLTDAAAAGGGFLSPAAWLYVGFIAFVALLLALDLGVFHRDAHEVSMKEALAWSAVWLSVGIAFTAAIWVIYDNHWLGIGRDVAQLGEQAARDVHGAEAAKLYLTGYVVEKSLAMDNIFVIAMIFTYFGIPKKYQHRVLFWGIVGALVMRGGMIGLGAVLVNEFKWILYVFGAFLVFTAIKMWWLRDKEFDVASNPVLKWIRRHWKVSDTLDGQRFFTKIDGKRVATPLLLALVMVEVVDLIFAVDSIPAIFAITMDPFIVFTSNVLAILGLRSLYFCLAALLGMFHYLKYALIAILLFVGVKIFLVPMNIKIDPATSLGVVLALLAAGVVASVLKARASRGADTMPAHATVSEP